MPGSTTPSVILDPFRCLRVTFRDPLLDRIIQIIKIHGANCETASAQLTREMGPVTSGRQWLGSKLCCGQIQDFGNQPREVSEERIPSTWTEEKSSQSGNEIHAIAMFYYKSYCSCTSSARNLEPLWGESSIHPNKPKIIILRVKVPGSWGSDPAPEKHEAVVNIWDVPFNWCRVSSINGTNKWINGTGSPFRSPSHCGRNQCPIETQVCDGIIHM